MQIRNATASEFHQIGELMVRVYAALEGFPKETDQPDYYRLLRKVGDLTLKPGVEIMVAVDEDHKLFGAVVYFSDMQQYGSGGTATLEKNAAGFRLLAVHPECRGKGIGRLLTRKCIERTRQLEIPQLIIHSTKAMQIAWGMYERMGFERSEDLDFMQGKLPVFGFRLRL